jgi:hypothetical protein
MRTPTISIFCAPTRRSSSPGRLPDTGRDLASQPTLSRLKNAPALRDVSRRTYALVDQWMASYEKPPSSVTIDIDDTCDIAHGHQRLSLFNAHYDERCFSADPCLRHRTEPPRRHDPAPGKDAVRRRGESASAPADATYPQILADDPHPVSRRRHYARPEAMAWREDHGVDYVFGLPGTKPLSKKVDETADAVRIERALNDKDVVRGYAETRHRAKSWDRERRAIARIEATRLGLDIRFVVTNLSHGAPHGSTTASIARADRRKASSSCTRRSFAPIEPHAARRSPIRCASSCTPPPIG